MAHATDLSEQPDRPDLTGETPISGRGGRPPQPTATRPSPPRLKLLDPRGHNPQTVTERLYLPQEDVHRLTFFRELHLVAPHNQPIYFRQCGSSTPELRLVK